jgi:hypothetical protein
LHLRQLFSFSQFQLFRKLSVKVSLSPNNEGLVILLHPEARVKVFLVELKSPKELLVIMVSGLLLLMVKQFGANTLIVVLRETLNL